MAPPDAPASVPAGPAQPNLFDLDDPALDVPVPFTLTVRGRRVVDPSTPALRLVGGRDLSDGEPSDADRAGPAAPHPGRPDRFEPREQDRRLVADLDHGGTWREARVRALARSGTSVDDIAGELELAPTVVRAWLTDPAVPADAGSSGRDRDVVAGRRSVGDVVPADVQGLALLAAVGTVEPGAVVATTNRIGVGETLVAWLRGRHGVTPGQVRVILQVADRATADLVARAWADRLDLTPDRVSVVAWSRAPGPRDVQATIRTSGRDLATRVDAQLRAWPLVPPA